MSGKTVQGGYVRGNISGEECPTPPCNCGIAVNAGAVLIGGGGCQHGHGLVTARRNKIVFVPTRLTVRDRVRRPPTRLMRRETARCRDAGRHPW